MKEQLIALHKSTDDAGRLALAAMLHDEEIRFRQGSRRFAWPAEIGLRYRFSSSRGDGGCGV